MVTIIGRILILVAAAFAAAAVEDILICNSAGAGLFERSHVARVVKVFVPEGEVTAPVPLLDCGNERTLTAVMVKSCAKQELEISFNTPIYLNSSSHVQIHRLLCAPQFPIHLEMSLYCPNR